MSELSMDELLAETGELLPERETLGSVAIVQTGSATAVQSNALGAAFGNTNIAQNIQTAAVVGSANSHHTTIFHLF
jgi:hypothetical protein